jgi:chromosome segregation protein
MFLKSLELNGFKSFAQKTVLEFPLGITGVVGPNGAGKSNLIDAIKWLLGEREAKNLRGGKAEDLIFNGTPQKPRMGMAQASLYFDNSSGFFPVDFKEVAVSRQVSRDGTSKYFLNKSEARLKDIIDFFSRSRLGTKGLIIINQGESDSFVKAPPEERRLMMEEILGLREYQIKKNEAERKLKSASFNLEKAKAMMEEVAPRLKMLRRQTGKWEKRVKYEEELDGLEKKYFSRKIKEIKDGRADLEPSLNALSGQIAGKKDEVKKTEEDLKKMESAPGLRLKAKEEKIEQEKLADKRLVLQKELGRLEAKMEFLALSRPGKEKTFSGEDAAVLLREIRAVVAGGIKEENIENLKFALKKLAGKIDKFFDSEDSGGSRSEEAEELKKIKENLLKDLDEIEKEIGLLKKKEEKADSEMEEFNVRFQKFFEVAEEKRKELRNLEEKMNKALFEKERLDLRLDDLRGQLRQIDKKPEDFDGLETEAAEAGEMSDLERKIFRLRGELAAIGEIDESLVKETEEVERHYNFLSEQSADLKKAIADLKGMIKELSAKIHSEFAGSLRLVNAEFNKFFRMMFSGGSASLKVKNYEIKEKPKGEILEGEEEKISGEEGENGEAEKEPKSGIEIEIALPKRRINGLEMLSGGERSLVSIAVLFSLISISPPPFLVLDEIDAALDESNTRRFSNMIKEFSKKTQFIIVTHNRATMESADVLYGVTMEDDGTSRVLSVKLENKYQPTPVN